MTTMMTTTSSATRNVIAQLATIHAGQAARLFRSSSSGISAGGRRIVTVYKLLRLELAPTRRATACWQERAGPASRRRPKTAPRRCGEPSSTLALGNNAWLAETGAYGEWPPLRGE
uniref:Uncharacterized protein n=1 Tax=Amycolatopsis mediterranei TaxID=33910 RepID=B2XSC3_AMYMD|nr:hypothetical protein amp105 [Amycolatopsis mediterranei]